MSELKACPFCGEHPEMGFGSAPNMVGCRNHECPASGLWNKVESWNTRPLEAEMVRAARLEGAEAAIKEAFAEGDTYDLIAEGQRTEKETALDIVNATWPQEPKEKV